MADYTSLPSGTPATTGQTQSYMTQERRGASGIAWAALIIGIILIILVIIIGVMFFRNRNTTGNPGWSVVTGGTTATEKFSPDGDDIYMAAARTASFTVTVDTSSTTLDGRMFMIDNTANAATVILTVAAGTGVTITDNVGTTAGAIPGRKSAQYIWISSSNIVRLT